MEKLELKHLAPYLPYDIKMKYDIDGGSVWKLDISNINAITEYDKPILIQVHNLTSADTMNLLECLGVEWGIISKFNGDYLGLPYKNIEKAFENHIDVFGLIPRGLAYDKHILEK